MTLGNVILPFFRSENQPQSGKNTGGKNEDNQQSNKREKGKENKKTTAQQPKDEENKVGSKIEDNDWSNRSNEKGEENQEPPKQQPIGTVDLFKGYDKRMTVVFHSLLAPHFKYDKSGGDRICMKFGDAPFGDFKKDLVELQPIRCVVHAFFNG